MGCKYVYQLCLSVSGLYVIESDTPSLEIKRLTQVMYHSGLKRVVNSEGIWKIQKAAKSGQIEVFKTHETGHGNILTPEFVEWRSQS